MASRSHSRSVVFASGFLLVATMLAACGRLAPTRDAAAPTDARRETAPALPAGQATEATRAANARMRVELPFANRRDIEDAHRGFLATRSDAKIRNAAGAVVWDLDEYAFLGEGDVPETVNPSLGRQSQLVRIHGLFKVTDRIYQVRGFDLSNVTFVEGDHGWIVIDPLISEEPARAALELVNQTLGTRPVVAVIYTHSHIDHFGGVGGVTTAEEVASGRVKVIAPAEFLENAVSENVMAGNVMARRATYMYGNLLPKAANGSVGAGLGPTTSNGTSGLLVPTHTITRTGEQMRVDGVRIVFQMAPDTEAPSEMLFHFPDLRALCAAEDAVRMLHNLYTLRGAKVRDARAWSGALDEAIDLFASDTDVLFVSHTWPVWGKENVRDYLEKQRDLYRYLHDQTLHLANQGYTMNEIAARITLPPSLAHDFYLRGYYGTVSHDVKAIYQRYLGWFDGNPAHLDPLPPEDAAKRYVEYMGGSREVIRRARESFARGDYRWVAEVMSHVVFAEPENQEAKELEAAAFEQLGFQAESGPWRNFYLTGASELRAGIRKLPAPSPVNERALSAMTSSMIFDYLAVRLDGARAGDTSIRLNVRFTDTHEDTVLALEHGVLNAHRGRQDPRADATLSCTRRTFDRFLAGTATVDELVRAGDLRIDGRAEAISELVGLLDAFDFWFPIVTP